MKVQLGANAVVIGSKKLNAKNPNAVQQALAAPTGKRRMIEITVLDDNGQECVFTVPARLFKGGSFGGFITLKGEARLVLEDAPAGKDVQQAAKEDAKLAALTDELLAD